MYAGTGPFSTDIHSTHMKHKGLNVTIASSVHVYSHTSPKEYSQFNRSERLLYIHGVECNRACTYKQVQTSLLREAVQIYNSVFTVYTDSPVSMATIPKMSSTYTLTHTQTNTHVHRHTLAQQQVRITPTLPATKTDIHSQAQTVLAFVKS